MYHFSFTVYSEYLDLKTKQTAYLESAEKITLVPVTFSKKIFKKLTSMKALQPYSSCILFDFSPADAIFSPSCLA